MKRTLMASAALIACAGSAAYGQTFLDRASWEAAANGPVITPDLAAASPIDFAPGVATSVGGAFDVLATGGGVGDASLNAVPNFVFDFAPGGLSSVTFTFSTPITAFAGEWSNTFVQDGFAVESGSGAFYDLGLIGGEPLGSNQFIGVVEPGGFSTLTFTTATPGGDDFVFFTAFEFVEIPSPGTAALLGVAGVAAVRRRR